ncbi:MAG: protein kinase [Planctomycetes bacterium]|nr:protein kinase [Planctomycetota bacterium]
MSRPTLASVLKLLRKGQLLGPDEMRALEDLQRRYRGGPSELVRAVLKRGWLTAYQAQELFAGRGHELQLGGYVVLGPLGEGSTARVFKARYQGNGRVVALKVLREGLLPDEAVDRLCHELWAGAGLEHPNLLQTYGGGRAGESYFLVMEYATGRNLARMVRDQGALPVGRACDYARQAALGLQHALERGLVHRDVKPSNLLLTSCANVVKVLDLGLASLAGAVPASAASGGTPDYMAPEQAVDPGRVDTRADVYALGCTLYHLLTGHPPFPGGGWEEKLRRHRGEEPQPVERLRPELPRGLGEVVRTMMAKSAAARFPTPGAVTGALTPFAEPGSCDSCYILELDEQGLTNLDPSQATAVLSPVPGRHGPYSPGTKATHVGQAFQPDVETASGVPA